MDSVVKDFFVSYTSVDKAWATWIAYILEADGYTVTIQEWDFRPGSNFAVEMDKALKQCPRMIAVLSPAYLQAQFPTPEWTAVFASDPEGAKNALVPVMVEECRPTGLLSQVVHIRIQGKDEDTARKMVLEGVRRERNKPTTPPPFPGPSATSAPPPTASVPFPAAAPAAGRVAAGRLRWQTPGPPITVSWHRDLDPMHAGQGRQGAAVVEVHLVFSGEDARVQVSELSDLKDQLPDHGRRTGIFTRLEALEAHSDATLARATGGSWDNAKGLAVTLSGQRSTWAPLPRGSLGSVIDVEHLSGQVDEAPWKSPGLLGESPHLVGLSLSVG
ncbi:toll/interleukin-1 receptor domain-containing protein, partial [Paractinoplanes hotanensis]